MIISDKYKCIFIRIPKTGSTTVEQALIANDPDCIRSNNEQPPYGHYCASQVREMAGEERWSTYYKFTFVRTPYDWFVSNYKDHCRFIIDEGDVAKTTWAMLNDDRTLPPFKETDTEGVGILDGAMALTLLSMIQFWWHGDFMPGGKHGNVVQQTSWIDEELDFVGKLEHFDDHWYDICMRIGFPVDYNPGRRNATPPKYKQINISPQAKYLIQAAYRQDFRKHYPELFT